MSSEKPGVTNVDLDGLERDLYEVKVGLNSLRVIMKPHIKRFFHSFYKKPSDITHSWTNLFKEAQTAHPEVTSRFDAVIYGAALLTGLFFLGRYIAGLI